MRGHGPSDRPGVLHALRVPVLATSGGPTSFFPQEWVADLLEIVADGAVVTIDAGHEVHATRPTELADALRAFLG